MSTPSWFDNVAEVYERARPLYPERLFDDLFAYLAETVRPSGSVSAVEIGPGTGQATAPLLARGATVTAVEPGPRLAAFLRRKFTGTPRLHVVNGRFETAPLPPGAHDLVLAATSFHWVEPGVRLAQASALLRDRGVLAVIDTNQIASPVDRGYFERSFPIYLRYRPDERQTTTPGEGVTPPVLGEIAESGRFEDVRLFRYRWDQTYATAAYADLVRSYSNTQQMEPEAREALIRDLCALIDEEYDGYVVRPLVITLVVGRKAEATTARAASGPPLTDPR